MSRVITLAMAATCLLESCRSGSGDAAGTAAQPNITANCPGITHPVRRATDSIPEDRACAYVRGAIQAVSTANPTEAGVAPEDTGAISSVTVDAIAQVDSAGGPIAAWWLVTLHLAGRPYDAEVRLNQLSGERSVRPVHK